MVRHVSSRPSSHQYCTDPVATLLDEDSTIAKLVRNLLRILERRYRIGLDEIR